MLARRSNLRPLVSKTKRQNNLRNEARRMYSLAKSWKTEKRKPRKMPISLGFWRPRRDSNARRPALEACALSCWATGTYGIKTLQAVYHQSLLAMSNYRLENSTCRYPYKHMEYPKAGLQRHADDNGFHNTDLLVDIPVITGLKI